ncbi:vWA-like protein [Gonapodya prolifera JEL478]|uniref:VWA-like protein n=1 Tax=Gonapodya prolifera (strain JEL478) TaxID=1344416 RepID=A0A138ZZ56_GONPJ|nr:vWA-like protein [Gonapodya prolifera JEL478]|eukprot:KXS09413.1 vWA-like protein [Gonapodya prolifera JEL478]
MQAQMRMLMAGSKDLAFTLDVSGSMSGTFIHQCRTSINEIIDSHCGQNDLVALLVFDNTVRQVFDWTFATDGQKAVMRNLVNNDTRIGGSTAFWDALVATARRMAKVKDHKGRSLWICTLTDGGDNASRSTSTSVIAELKKLPQVGLIAITVGVLSNEAEIRRVCEASRNRGLFIRAEASGQGIQTAFRAAIQHMEDYAVQQFT